MPEWGRIFVRPPQKDVRQPGNKRVEILVPGSLNFPSGVKTVVALWKMAVVLGGAWLLAGCAPMEEPVVYYPVYRPIHRQVYVSRPPVVDPSDDSGPPAPVVQAPPEEPSPEPDKSWSDWSPISPAKASPAPAPPPSPPPLVGADPTCGWWRLCNIWEDTQ
jgi:hypothetical protein